MSQIASKGNSGVVDRNKFVFRNKEDDISFEAIEDSNLYKVDLEMVNKEANSAQRATLDLWHERLGHVNRRTIEKMMKEASVDGLIYKPETEKGNGEDIVKCDACVLGKQHRHPIPASGRERAKQVRDAVHVDLCGPIGTEAIDESFCFVLFKDEFSNFRIVFVKK